MDNFSKYNKSEKINYINENYYKNKKELYNNVINYLEMLEKKNRIKEMI